MHQGFSFLLTVFGGFCQLQMVLERRMPDSYYTWIDTLRGSSQLVMCCSIQSKVWKKIRLSMSAGKEAHLHRHPSSWVDRGTGILVTQGLIRCLDTWLSSEKLDGRKNEVFKWVQEVLELLYIIFFRIFFEAVFCFTDQWTYSKNHENSDHEMPGCGLRKADGWCAVCHLGPFRSSSQKGIARDSGDERRQDTGVVV